MKVVKNAILILSITVGNYGYASSCGKTGVSYIRVPTGYNKVGEKSGVCMFQKGDITVHVADIQSGAKLDFIYKTPYDWSKLKNDKWAKIYPKQNIYELFNLATSRYSKAITVTNAQFFGSSKGKFFMSFPVKSNGYYISQGPDMRIPSEKTNWDYKILNFNNNKISVNPYSPFNLSIYGGKSIVGYRHSYRGPDVRCTEYIGRTYAAVQKRTRKSSGPMRPNSQSLLIFNAKGRKCDYMERVISNWGITMDQVVMFDGSGSSQFKSKIRNKVQNGDNRDLPMGLVLTGY